MKSTHSKEAPIGCLERIVRRSQGIHERLAREIEKIMPNVVECDHCGRKREVDFAQCLRTGWPECCGETMTLNGPVTLK